MTPRFSFEFFPPRSPAGERRFWRTVGCLENLDPAFFSITYGALGSGQEQSLTTVEAAAAECSTPIAAHLTFEGSTRAETDAVARRFRDAGVTRLVALRGDAREDAAAAHKRGACYESVPQLIEGLLQIHPFDVSVACYPETHPKAATVDADLLSLKAKCEAGADRAITQFFFDVDDFERFRDRVVAMGVTTPLVAGLLPIREFARVCDFSAKCGARVPQRLHQKFADATGDLALQLAEEELQEFVSALQQRGCQDFHVYTLNQAAGLQWMGGRQPVRAGGRSRKVVAA